MVTASEMTAALETILDTVHEGLVVTQNGRVVFHNAAFARQVTYSPAEFTATTFEAFVHPDDRAEVSRRHQAVLTGETETLEHEFRTVAKEGGVRWYRVRARRLQWRGQPAVVTVFGEITEAKRAGAALRDSEVKYGHLLDAVPIGVFEVDLSTRKLLRLNDYACQMLGYRRDELMELGPMGVLTNESRQRALERMQAVAAGRDVPATVEYEMVAKDGRTLPTLLNTTVTRKEDGTATSVVVVQDMTEQKGREQDAARVEKLEALGILAGGIAHDFNNLLTAILGGIASARYALTPNNPAEPALADVEEACVRARGLTHQLLTFAAGGAPIRRSVATMELVREHTEFALRGSNVACRVDGSEGVWPVTIDENQINQVITNVVINASQAMPEGGSLHVGATNREVGASGPAEAGRYVEIWFRDSGVGISREHLARVFDPYFTTKQAGSGLGLATAHSIVSRHGGRMTLESELGEGTTVRLLLPAAAEHPTAPSTQPPERGHGRVLLMDDEALVRDAARRLLTALGYEVVCAEDGAAAVELYEAQRDTQAPFDLVLMDLTVRAGMGGIEAWAAIRELDPDAKGIVASGYSTNPVMSQPADFGFQGVIAKPFTLEELATEVARVLKA